MGVILVILQFVCIVLLILLLMILFIPIIYTLNGMKKEYYFLSFQISWLGRILYILIQKEENQPLYSAIVFLGFRIPIHPGKAKRVKINKIKQPRKATGGKAKYVILFHSSLLKPLFKFFQSLFRNVFPQEYQFHLRYGFSDPADTGMLSGLITLLWPLIPPGDINLYPVFGGEVLEGECMFKGRIILAVIIYSFLQFYFARGIRPAIRKIRTK